MTIDCQNELFKKVLEGSIWEGRSLFDLYKEAYTPWEWHEELFKIAKEIQIDCFSTPFDKSAVDFLENFNPPAYKIASFEILDIPLIKYVASKGRPIIISTGIAEMEDIDLAIKTCHEVGNNDITLLKCTSSYPAPLDEANLVTIPDLKEKYGINVGLSDHTMGIVAPIVAVSLGATVIEKHFILDKSIGGPDASFSLDERAFTEMVNAVRQAELAIGKVTYELTSKAKNSRKFSRSLFVVKDIKAGETFTEENVRSIRPGYGLHPKYFEKIIGKTSKRNILKGTPLKMDFI